jgi:hypothetical protein
MWSSCRSRMAPWIAPRCRRSTMTGLAEVAGDDPEPEYRRRERPRARSSSRCRKTTTSWSSAPMARWPAAISAPVRSTLRASTPRRTAAWISRADAAGVLREPDAVKWIDADHFVTANEGDWKGGSRSFTIFNRDGSVVFESGASLERAIAALGHYPEHRNKKGVELESVEVADLSAASRCCSWPRNAPRWWRSMT